MGKKIDLPGTVRSKSPSDTLQHILPHLSQFGIVSVSKDSGFQTLPLPIYQAVRPLAKSVSVTQGKGVTDELSMISAIMEAIEFSIAENIPVDIADQSFNEMLLLGLNTLDPRKLAIGTNDKISQLKMAWTKGINLVTNESTYLPTNYFDMDYTKLYPEQRYFYTVSNGLASGNSWSEAVVHALLELIERYSMSRAKVRAVSERKQNLILVDSISESHPYVDLLEIVRERNYLIFIENLPNEFGLPCFHCEIKYRNLFDGNDGYHGFIGAGCHFDRDIALSRALSEAAQSAVCFISNAKDNLGKSFLPRQHEASVYNGDWQPTLNFETVPNLPTGSTFDEDQKILLARLQQCGHDEVYALDISSKTPEIPVAFVAVPGMKYAWA